MVKKELAKEKLNVLVNLHKQTICDRKDSLVIQQLDKDNRINSNRKFEAIIGPCPA